jgi:predicted nucleic acid-binding protein
MTYLLDTNICIYFLKRHSGIINRFAQCLDDEIAISIITLAELQFGAHNSIQVENNIKRIKFFLERVQLLDLTPKTTDIFARIKALLRKSGNIIDDFDILIGATAIENNLTLVTDNERHFSRIEKIRMVNWLE